MVFAYGFKSRLPHEKDFEKSKSFFVVEMTKKFEKFKKFKKLKKL